MSNQTPRPLWTIADVATYLQVTESSVRNWIYERRVRFLKIGSLIRFVPEEIIEDAHNGKIGSRKDNRPA